MFWRETHFAGTTRASNLGSPSLWVSEAFNVFGMILLGTPSTGASGFFGRVPLTLDCFPLVALVLALVYSEHFPLKLVAQLRISTTNHQLRGPA